jgi:hypothetical protein
MAAIRLTAQFNLCRDEKKAPCNVVNYDGAIEIVGPALNGVPTTIALSFRGQFSGAVSGATDEERLKAAESAAKAEVLKRLDEVKVEIEKYDPAGPPPKPPTMTP